MVLFSSTVFTNNETETTPALDFAGMGVGVVTPMAKKAMMEKEEEGELSRESMAWTLWQALSPLCCLRVGG